jgi:hypothetical protein
VSLVSSIVMGRASSLVDRNHRHKVGDDEVSAMETVVVIPGRSAAEGKGIHDQAQRLWIPFPRLRLAGDDTHDVMAGLVPAIPIN